MKVTVVPASASSARPARRAGPDVGSMRVVIADHSLTVRSVQGKSIVYAMRPAFVR